MQHASAQRATNPLLAVNRLTLQRQATCILKDVSFSLNPGDILVLSGHSGSGKTSLLRLMALLDSPTSGEIMFQQQPLTSWIPHVYRKQVALVFQAPIFFPGSVEENLTLVEQLNGKQPKPIPFYQHALNQVGLSEKLLTQDALQLSQGEKLRLSIARALLNQPQILLLDEPLSALDAHSAQYLLEALQRLNREQGLSIMMVTHQPCPIPFGTRTFLMENGCLREDKDA